MDVPTPGLERILHRITTLQARLDQLAGPAGQPAAGGFARLLEEPRPSTATPTPTPLDPLILRAAEQYRLRPELLRAVIHVESRGDPRTVSPRGAIGLMQLMPATATALGVSDPFDPEQNILGGARYLREQLDRFSGDERLALAAYNAGPGAVLRHHGIPPYAETQRYVTSVLELATP